MVSAKEVFSVASYEARKRSIAIARNAQTFSVLFSRESRSTKTEAWLWNGMMELVDMPGKSILLSISRLLTCHLKRVRGVFRGPFCDPTEGVPKFWFDDFSVWEVTHSGKKWLKVHRPKREHRPTSYQGLVIHRHQEVIQLHFQTEAAMHCSHWLPGPFTLRWHAVRLQRPDNGQAGIWFLGNHIRYLKKVLAKMPTLACVCWHCTKQHFEETLQTDAPESLQTQQEMPIYP